MYINPTVSIFDITVVVGKATQPATKSAHRVIALAVPLSFILNLSTSQFTGVPVLFVTIEVIAAARAVISTMSQSSVLYVGVALDVSAVTLFVILLFVSVCVDVNHANVWVVVGNVIVVLSVPDSVILLVTDNVLPLVIVIVPVVVVIVNPLMLVAVAAPNTGVTNVGDVENTIFVEAVPVVPVADVR